MVFRYQSVVLSFLSICITTVLFSAQVRVTNKESSHGHMRFIIDIHLKEGEYLFRDSVHFSTDHPDTEVSITKSPEYEDQYIQSLHTTKQVYTTNNPQFDVSAEKHSGQPIINAHVHMTYMTSAHRKPQELTIPIVFEQQSSDTKKPHTPLQEKKSNISSFATRSVQAISSWSRYVENVIQTTEIWWVRFLLIILLGLLMSFTPCIYPMIPITIGIMQGQGERKLFTNFMHACAYSLGIAFTFALMGLLAVMTGMVFGSLLTSPIVVLLIVAMLTYLAGSMFGFYEMYIPTFLQTGSSRKHHGSIGSSFLFGALSGTVASPCLSPGLALVLGIVAALGSKLLGFLLLFAFGIGLSIPLMIIGTFSGSLSVLPRAGYWMIEVKKLFGFLLLGMCFYYLKNILPFNILLWIISLFCAVSGVFYLYTIGAHDTKFWKRTKNLLGMLFIIASVLLAIQAYQHSFQMPEEHDTFWSTDYEVAVQTSAKDNKFLFIDFWAPSCSICTAIEKIHFKDPKVREALLAFIPVKLELVMSDPTIARLKEEFNIMGLPAIILYNPANKKIVKRWGSELYQTDKETFISELKQLSA